MDFSDKDRKWLSWLIVVVLIVISTITGVKFPIPLPPLADDVIELGTTHFTNVEAEDLTATDDLTVTDDASIGDALSVTGAATLSGVLSVAGASTLTGEVTVGGHVTVTGNVTATNLIVDDVTVADDLTVADDVTISGLFIPAATTLTATDGLTITAVAAAYHLDAASAVTVTLAACSSNGQLLILYGDDAYTITIDDVNVRTTDGAKATIGQYDAIAFLCDDTEWIHLLKSANQ